MSPKVGKTFVFPFRLQKYQLNQYSVWATGLNRVFRRVSSQTFVQQAVVSEVTFLKTPGSLAADSATASKIPLLCFLKNLVLCKGPLVYLGRWEFFTDD